MRDNVPGKRNDGFRMTWVGQSIERVEDASLLTGRGRYIDDLGVPPGTLHAAVLRSPHPHAVIRAIDVGAARAAKGVAAVVTAADVTALRNSIVKIENGEAVTEPFRGSGFGIFAKAVDGGSVVRAVPAPRSSIRCIPSRAR